MKLTKEQLAQMSLRWSNGQLQVDYSMDAMNLMDTIDALESELARERARAEQLQAECHNAFLANEGWQKELARERARAGEMLDALENVMIKLPTYEYFGAHYVRRSDVCDAFSDAEAILDRKESQ